MWSFGKLRVSVSALDEKPSTIKYGVIDSKFGKMFVGLTPLKVGAKSCDAVCVLYFMQTSELETLKKAQQHWPETQFVADKECVDKWNEALASDKENEAVIDVAIVGTDLQQTVWQELVKIKAGSTVTYSELAELIGRPKAVRAVANAVAKNEVSIIIPCHRVVSKSGEVKYHWGAELKNQLLDYEANVEKQN